MPSPAEQAIYCPSTGVSASPHLPHGHIHSPSQGVTQDLCEKPHRSGHCVRDLDYLCLLLFTVNLIWLAEGRISGEQPLQSLNILHVLLFWSPVITMTITTRLGQAKLQWVVLCEWSRSPVQEWELADCQSPFLRMHKGAGIEDPPCPNGSLGCVGTCRLASPASPGVRALLQGVLEPRTPWG